MLNPLSYGKAGRKMREKLLNNLGLKLLACFLAIVIWITIINVIDPSDSKTITGLQVDFLNEETLTSLGYTFNVLEGSVISINVVGPTTVVNNLVASDFYASADFSTISPLSDYVDIDVRCTKNSISLDNVKITPRTTAVRINIENRESITADVEVELVGEPAAGYTTGDYDVSPMAIKITGAESIIESIDRVVAEYDVEGASLDINDNVALKLYDADGNTINISDLVLSKDAVRIKVPLLVRKVVPVNYVSSGTVKEGYKVAKFTYSVENIVIAGTQAAVDAINSIDIPAEAIDISDLSEDMNYTIRISHYVPTTVKVISEAVSEVTVSVEPLVTKEISISTKNITLVNNNVALNYSFARDTLRVVYSGLSEDIEKITSENIVATADVSGLPTGSSNVKIKFENVENCTVVGEYTTAITISR